MLDSLHPSPIASNSPFFLGRYSPKAFYWWCQISFMFHPWMIVATVHRLRVMLNLIFFTLTLMLFSIVDLHIFWRSHIMNDAYSYDFICILHHFPNCLCILYIIPIHHVAHVAKKTRRINFSRSRGAGQPPAAPHTPSVTGGSVWPLFLWWVNSYGPSWVEHS